MGTLQPILAKHPFFAGLEEPQLNLLAGCASNERYKVGDFLFHEGQEAKRFFILREGLVELRRLRRGDLFDLHFESRGVPGGPMAPPLNTPTKP